MADLIPFSYRQGNSLLHRMDVRYKFFVICLTSISIMSANLAGCFFYFIILFFLFKVSGLNLYVAVRRIKYFVLLLCFVFTARALTVNGDIVFSVYGVSATAQGMTEGFLVASKFFLVMVTGLLFSFTTKPSAVKSAVQWFLKPVPFLPEKRIAVMISLALGFIPVIARQAGQIAEAQTARCADLEKNPAKRTIRLVLPLLKKTVLSADSLVLAMESRCYSDDRTDPEFTVSGKEPLFLATGILISLSLIFL